MYKKMNMGVVGCGVIGESLAGLLEDLGHVVKRYDPAKNLTDNISNCNIIFICVPTNKNMAFEDIKTAVAYTNLKNKKGIITIRSTLMPGMIDEFAKEYNRDFVYLPEFLRERSALEDEIKPDKVIVGTNKIEIFKLFEKLFKPIIDTKKILMMKPVEAELVKVALNSLYTVKVIFGNELYDICQKYGADYCKLLQAFKLDKWINPQHLDPLFDGYRGAGGKCLPKDLKFLIKAGVVKGYLPEMIELADEENESLLEKGVLSGE
ncbi:MAG: UDP-glucose/GDP-mannose dehydrogenase family protein [Candidatus Marinimicrobia bacterium]|nr:UDP-glucose/GDP-mannose dehydrogenase family protein [Candidatus Neomarinimicrobiota bacterium]MCK4446489.1 UDP-glucose/GDP-mannose dehydrogenase family protein [Candidatus Neomarinimicrobiota bacterium]